MAGLARHYGIARAVHPYFPPCACQQTLTSTLSGQSQALVGMHAPLSTLGHTSQDWTYSALIRGRHKPLLTSSVALFIVGNSRARAERIPQGANHSQGPKDRRPCGELCPKALRSCTPNSTPLSGGPVPPAPQLAAQIASRITSRIRAWRQCWQTGCSMPACPSHWLPSGWPAGFRRNWG